MSRAGAIQEATESAAPRFVGMLAAILPAALLIQALVNLAQYRQPAVPVVVWAGMLATAAWLVPRAGSAGLSATEATAAVAVAVVAVDLVLRTLPPQPVTLTVLASAGEAELYLTFERAPHGMPGLAGLDGTIPASAQWQATMDAEEAGAGCLEIRWRRSPALGALA